MGPVGVEDVADVSGRYVDLGGSDGVAKVGEHIFRLLDVRGRQARACIELTQVVQDPPCLRRSQGSLSLLLRERGTDPPTPSPPARS